jgi:mxaJ protein
MIRRACFAAVVLFLVSGLSARSTPAAAPLRVCSDPNNLPFSSAARDGFENRIADLLARDMKTRVEYTWHAQRRGFVRETLNAGRCDVVMATPPGTPAVRTTKPYYRSSYVFVTRPRRSARITSFDDPALRTLRIGVQLIGDDGANSPPAHALSRRGIIGNVFGYSVYGDYATASPPSRIVRAVADGEVDVAAVWGPLAGYYAARQQVPLEIVPVQPQIDHGIPQAFDIAMAVRRDDARMFARVERFLVERRVDIDRILDEYSVPRVAGGGGEP